MMVDPSSEDDGILREWAPLTNLLGQIPLKAQRGLFTGDLNLTCIAALPNFLAIGTNHGLVYWYDRRNNELQRLRCENTVCAITCISVVSTVDYMIAAGTSIGAINVFLVPKVSPCNIPDIFKTNAKKQIERYTVGDLHSTPISAIEWSPNGMKLFSGDQNGVVVLTEIDYYMHLSKSIEILNEKYEVVQLSYNSSNQLLLVSTLYRTIMSHKSLSDNTWKVSQVGNKERKVLGKMGATFFNNPENPRSPVVYCSRPGLRLWAANKDGTVEKTLIFKESVQGQYPLIPLLNPTKSRDRHSRGEPQLGTLSMFKDTLLVTHTADALLILDPITINVVAALFDVQKISALCVSKSEIFILEGERHLIRLGFSPEDTSIKSSIDEASFARSGALANHLLDLTAKIKEAAITSVIPKKLSPIFSPTKSPGSSDGDQISECFEAQELPPVLSLDFLKRDAAEQLPELQVCSSSHFPSPSEKGVYTRAQRSSTAPQKSLPLHSELLDQSAQEQYEEVVFHLKRKTKKNKSKRIVTTATGTESGSDSTSVVSTTSENDELWPSERLDAGSEWSSINTSRRSSVDALSKPEYLGNLGQHSEEDINESLAAKERLLAKKYNLEDVLGIKSDEEKTAENKCEPTQPSINEEKTNTHACTSKDDLQETHPIEECMEDTSQTLTDFESKGDKTGDNECFDGDKRTAVESPAPSDAKEEKNNSSLYKEAMEASGWLQFNTPKPIIWIAVCNYYLVAIDGHDIVHYCILGGLGLKWQQADCKANQLVVSPTSNCLWRLQNNLAYALKNPSTSGPHGEEWQHAETNIRSIAVCEDVVWLVTQSGDILYQKGLSKDVPQTESIKIERPCEWSAVKVVCFSQIVWILLSTGEVYMRLGVSSVKPGGLDWKRVNIPVPGSVVDIALGSQRTGWIVDNCDKIMFSVDHMEHDPHWWQILISDYIFQHTSPLQKLRSKISFRNLRPALPGHQSPLSCVACGQDSVWIFQNNSNSLHVNKSKITGHSWSRIKLKGSPEGIRWQSVTSEGVFESEGQVWLLSANGDLFCSPSYNNRTLKQISLPSSDGAVCLAASSHALWLLTSSGAIYIRQGLNEICLEGNDWTQLSLAQIEDVQLCHVSCGLDVVWACDTVGNMHMTVSSPHAMATATFSPVWIRVPDSKDQKKIFFIKVFVGPQTYMVWALDNQGKIYVREAIFPDFPLGADWVAVTGITAVDLSVSATAVWALSVEGDVYRRQGITQNNYIGDYWRKIPGSVEALSASMCDRLWGIDKNGTLLRHTQLGVSLLPGHGTPTTTHSYQLSSTGMEEDWEVL